MKPSVDILEKYWPHFADPRVETCFVDHLYPPVVGTEHGEVEVLGQLKDQFQAVYYRLNECHERLSKLGREDAGRQALLERSVELSKARDALEDACTPIGFVAEPVLSGLITTELKVTHVPVLHEPEQETQASSFSLYIEIPPLDDTNTGQPTAEESCHG